MNKREYLSALEAQLKRLPSDDVKEIVKEFDAHFATSSGEPSFAAVSSSVFPSEEAMSK